MIKLNAFYQNQSETFGFIKWFKSQIIEVIKHVMSIQYLLLNICVNMYLNEVENNSKYYYNIPFLCIPVLRAVYGYH